MQAALIDSRLMKCIAKLPASGGLTNGCTSVNLPTSVPPRRSPTSHAAEGLRLQEIALRIDDDYAVIVEIVLLATGIVA
jgi:hypothetical protein